MKTLKMLPIVLLICIGALFLSSSGFAAVKLDHAQWRVDIKFYKTKKSINSGTAQFFVQNTGSKTAELKSFLIDGRSVEELKEKNEITWWRMLPATVKPGEYASVMVRMRDTPTSEQPVVMEFSDGSRINTSIDPQKQNSGFRIESIGFDSGGKRLLVYFNQYGFECGNGVSTITAKLPGRYTFKPSWISKDFVKGIAAVEMKSNRALPVGDFLYLKAESESGKNTAYLIRINDGYVPFGTYDWPAGIEPEKLAAAGMTNVTMHGGLSAPIMDDLHALGIRTSSYTNYGPPSELYVTHPAMDTCLVTDEPDCQDYFYYKGRKDAPPYDRWIGQNGRRVVEGAQLVHESDKNLQAGVVLDMTLRPESFYEYGETADVVYSDNYALTNGDKTETIWQVQRDAMSGAAPNPVVHIFDDCWQEEEGRGINRPKTAAEQRRIMLYAFGQGAKGLVGWWNVSYDEGKVKFHGVEDFPDQWEAMSNVFQTLGRLSPLIPISQPIDAVNCRNSKIWTRSLVAGGNALIITAINEDFQYSRTSYLQSPAEDVDVQVAALPWLKPAAAYRVTPSGFEKLPMDVKKDGSATVKLGSMWVGDVVLLTSNTSLPNALSADYNNRQEKLAGSLLAMQRNKEVESAAYAAFKSDIRLNRAENLVQTVAAADGTRYEKIYNMSDPKSDNSNVIGWEIKDKPGTRMGVKWTVNAPAAGYATFVYQAQISGEDLKYELFNSEGASVPVSDMELRELKNGWAVLTVRFPAPGEYELHAFQPGKSKSRTAWIVRWAYFLPGFTYEDILNNKK